MSLWIASILVDGVALDFERVLASLSIRTGRAGVHDDPEASTCELELVDVARAFTRPFDVGVELAVDVVENPGAGPPVERVSARFRGRITDAELVDPRMKLTATGRLAELGRYTLDTTAWPAEAWSARVARVFVQAGFAYVLVADPGFDPILEPPPEDAIVASGYVTELARTVGAACYDRGDGTIVMAALGAREPGTVGRLPQFTIDPARVLYSPPWRQELDVTNSVRTLYGPDRATSATVSDPVSVDRYGERSVEIPTTISAYADAQARSARRLRRGAYPDWSIEPVTILEPGPLENVPVIGRPVRLVELPASAPWPAYAPIVEGWADRLEGPDWTIELHLSDPAASGVAARWQDAGAGFTWAMLEPGLTWPEVTANDDLGGSY